jgi:hypothetical protein
MMMNYIHIAILLIFALFELWEGSQTLMGKQDEFIKCLNKPRSEQYDVKRVRLVTALRKFVVAIAFLTLAFADESSMIFRFAIGLEILALVVLFVLNRTWVKYN